MSAYVNAGFIDCTPSSCETGRNDSVAVFQLNVCRFWAPFWRDVSVAGKAKNSNYFNILWKNGGRQSSIPIIENVWEDNYE
jgi:hypothetical protein